MDLSFSPPSTRNYVSVTPSRVRERNDLMVVMVLGVACVAGTLLTALYSSALVPVVPLGALAAAVAVAVHGSQRARMLGSLSHGRRRAPRARTGGA